jgi:uncharacterized repeat protein (TIGR03803 family)
LAQPVISTQPVNQFRTPGQAVVFSVVATGDAPLTYQWLFDATAMVDATNRLLSLVNPQPAQCGYYSVIVSNPSGSVTSQVAELKIFTAARHSFSGIHAQPDSSVSLSFAGETTAAFAPYYDLYPLEASSNLVDWVLLTTIQRTNAVLDTLSFLDTNAPEFSRRFYRTPTNQLVTPDPKPTGPYPVGTFSMVMTDSSRTNAAGKTNYQFMTTFWYPALAQAGTLPAKYLDPQVAATYGLSQVATFASHAQPNAPLASSLPRCPVVLYESSGNGHRRENTDKAEELASWGFVVIGLDSPYTPVSVFPNGEVVSGQPVVNTVFAASTGSIYADIESRLRDLQVVLDELEVLNASDPRLAGRLDLKSIGAFGWSFGGATVAQLCLRDPRCKACAAMDWMFVETNVLTQPPGFAYLSFRSDWAPDPDPQSAVAGGPDDRLEFYNYFATNAYWVKVVSTLHGSFGADGLILDSTSLENRFGIPMSGQLLPPFRVSEIVRAYLLSFFNKFLKGIDDHLLEGPSPAYPEVMQFLSAASMSVAPEYPSAALVQGSDGNFYSTTAYGGARGQGTIFRVTPDGTLTTLVSFDGTNGSHPVAGLIQSSNGNFYGTTAYGGTNGNNGTVFQMTPAGALTALVSFNGTNGGHPLAGLVQTSDGNFYGTTLVGGAYNSGTVFKMTSSGALMTLVSFVSGGNSLPFAALAEGTNGSFFGTTSVGGASGVGTVFTMSPGGALRTLASVTGEGLFPAAGLVQGQDGNFYGTTEYSGNFTYPLYVVAGGGGTVFKMTPTGALTTLVEFNGANGSYCASGLVQGQDGNFYGTTAGGGGGGSLGGGTVFRVTPGGVLTTLVSFNGANGNSPQAPLIQGSDGNFYGTTTYGGPHGGGTVFQVTTNGVLTTLVAFGSH